MVLCSRPRNILHQRGKINNEEIYIKYRFASNNSNVACRPVYKAASIRIAFVVVLFFDDKNVDVESSLPMSSGLGDGE